MHLRLKLAIAVATCLVLGFGGATAFVTLLESSPADADERRAASAPEGDVRIAAQAKTARGHTIGVVAYRSQDGRRCFDEGRVVNGQLGNVGPNGEFEPMPLEETGMCVAGGAPVALSMGEDHDDPSRAIVSGLTTPGATAVEVTSPQGRASARPADNGAFIVTLPAALDSEVQVRVTEPDGSTTTDSLHSLPAPDDPIQGPHGRSGHP